jgi:hypothetical protein
VGVLQRNLEKQPQTSCCISEATHFKYHDLKSAQPSSLLRSESQVSWLGLLLASLISVTPHLKPVLGSLALSEKNQHRNSIKDTFGKIKRIWIRLGNFLKGKFCYIDSPGWLSGWAGKMPIPQDNSQFFTLNRTLEQDTGKTDLPSSPTDRFCLHWTDPYHPSSG